MTPDEQQRFDALSSALANLVKRQQELESRMRLLEMLSGFKPPEPPPVPSPAPPPIRSPFPAETFSAPPPIHTPPPLHTPPSLQSPPPFEARQDGALSETQLETTVGLTWINRIAVVTLIFGAAFFFKYAVDNGWIGPAARVLLGVLSAILSLFFGDRMHRRTHIIFSQGLLGLGISLLYLSFNASFTLYHLLPQSAAFALMAMTTVAAGFIALQYNSQAIAMLALLGGYLTPILLSTGEDHPWFLFSYTFVLNIGGLAFTRARRWRLTEILSLVATVFLYAAWFGNNFSDSNRTVAATFALAFYAQFVFANARFIVFIAQFLVAVATYAIYQDSPDRLIILSLVYSLGALVVAEFRRWKETPPWALVCFWIPYGLWIANNGLNAIVVERGYFFELLSIGFAIFFTWVLWWAVISKHTLRDLDLTMFSANAAAYFVASYALLNPVYHHLMGYFAVALCLLYAAAAKLLSTTELEDHREPASLPPFVLATAISISFLTLAIPIQFEGFRITIAWSLQATALAWLAYRYRNSRLNLASWLVFLLVFGRLFAFDAWIASAMFGLRFLTFAIASVGLWLAAKFARREFPAVVPYILGHFVMLWNLGMEVVAWVARNSPADPMSVETTAISILMAVYALVLVILGVATRTVINRVLGLGLLGLVVAKLYLSDIWALSRIFRITAFLALGVLLLVVSYLYSRFKPVIERLWRNEARR